MAKSLTRAEDGNDEIRIGPCMQYGSPSMLLPSSSYTVCRCNLVTKKGDNTYVHIDQYE